jgi:putative transposase
MPWKVSDVIEIRLDFVKDWRTGMWTVAELCRHYEITRKTGYKWIERYESEGAVGLEDRSRASHSHPNAIETGMEDRILEARAMHPLWGARKIRALLERQGVSKMPAASTIGLVLKESGLTLAHRRRRSAHPNAAPITDAGEANQIWSADFKGWFRTQDGKRCDPLTISDVHTRYLLRCQAVAAADTLHAKPIFETAFREYGLPARMRTDNGAPFGSNGDSGLTALAVWWIRLGVAPERIRPGKPQENGRHERMHRTLKQATASPPARNRRLQQELFDDFRREYNDERPHEALAQTPPAQHYSKSMRAYPERLVAIEYPQPWQVRQVSNGGQIRWRGDCVFVSHALEGQPIGLEPVQEDLWRVCFSFYELGFLEERKRKIWPSDEWKKKQRSSLSQSVGADR